MNGIRSVTSEISVWKKEEKEQSTAVKHNGFSSTNVEDSHNSYLYSAARPGQNKLQEWVGEQETF